jgi:hypothetical protein
MVEQMEDRVNGEVDSFRDDMAKTHGDVGKALAAISELLDIDVDGGTGGLGQGSKLCKVQASVDLLQEGFENASTSAQVS